MHIWSALPVGPPMAYPGSFSLELGHCQPRASFGKRKEIPRHIALFLPMPKMLDATEVVISPLEGMQTFTPTETRPRHLELSSVVSESDHIPPIDDVFQYNSNDTIRHHSAEKAASPSVSILPLEILQIIFMFSRDQAFDETVFLSRIPRVSSRWRQTALACPPLWNRVRPSYHIPMKVTETYVGRSGTGPLQLIVEQYCIPSKKLAETIQVCSPRWSRIRIGNRHVVSYFLRLVSPQFSALQSLVLRHDLDLTGLKHQLSGLPALETLELSRFALSAESPLPATLKTLSITLCKTTSSWWRSMSQRCTSLETLRVSNVSQTDEFEDSVKISFPTLINLTLRLDTSHNPSAPLWVVFFANKICTPTLRSLDAVITNSMGSWSGLTKIIQDCPHITRITIGGDAKPMRRLMNDIIRSDLCTNNPSRSPSIVPRLSELVISFDSGPGPSKEWGDMNGFHRLLVRFLTTRAAAPLSRLSVTASWIKDDECIAGLVGHLDLIGLMEAKEFDLRS